MRELSKCVANALAVAVGPFASDKIPALAPDLRPWAFWISGIVAMAAVAVANDTIFGTVKAQRYLVGSGVLAVACAVSYFVINLVWTSESGTAWDLVAQIALVALYSFGSGAIALMTASAQKLGQTE